MSVLVGYDGTDSADDAAALGAQLALGEELVVVAVFPEENPIGVGRVDVEWVASMRERAEEFIARAQGFLEGRGVEAVYRIVGSRSAARALDELSEAEDASMIVVGSTRRGALGRISPGSTGDRLVHGAACPVAIAPRGHRERSGPLRQIGVAYVDGADAREALRVAGELAARAGAALTLYTVVAPQAEVSEGDPSLLMAVRDDARAALERASVPVPAERQLLDGEVVERLAELELDLLVCGSRGYGPVRRVLLGGVSRRLIQRAASPLLVVPRPSLG